MRPQSWQTTHFWQKDLHFNILPVTRGHLSWKTTFLWPVGWAFRTDSTVLPLVEPSVIKGRSRLRSYRANNHSGLVICFQLVIHQSMYSTAPYPRGIPGNGPRKCRGNEEHCFILRQGGPNPSLWLTVVPVILYDRPTPPPSHSAGRIHIRGSVSSCQHLHILNAHACQTYLYTLKKI